MYFNNNKTVRKSFTLLEDTCQKRGGLNFFYTKVYFSILVICKIWCILHKKARFEAILLAVLSAKTANVLQITSK